MSQDTNKLKSLGSFIFFELLEQESSSAILKISSKEPFSRGKVVGVQEEYSNLQTGTNIIYLTEKASPLGLGYPKNIYVIRYDDIVSIIL
jgi:hypothetical protein